MQARERCTQCRTFLSERESQKCESNRFHPGYGCMSCPRADAPESEVGSPFSDGSSSDLPDYEPGQFKEVFLTALQNIGGRSIFAKVDTTAELPNPGLQIVDQRIGLPLSEHDAKAIISQACESPFGKGDQTLVDQTVRKSWELNPTQFQLRNPAWQSTIQNIVKSVYQGFELSCGVENVRAELHKLLLYEEGAFFRSHQDSEKAPGMFGTLVICLSSQHEGGLLKLKHNGQELQFDSSANSEFGSSWAAWFSNIFHEVLPVTTGYRLVLTYDLIADRAATYTPVPPFGLGHEILAMQRLFRHWETNLTTVNFKHPKFLVHKLSHRYTQASLSMKALKGDDLTRAEVLHQVAAEQGASLYLANVKKTLHKDDDDDYEVLDTDLELTYVSNMDGKEVSTGFTLREENILDDGDFNEDDYDGSEHEGYTGNAGAPCQYWYNDTVLVIVPKSGEFDFLINGKTPFQGASQLIAQHKDTNARDQEGRATVLRLCQRVLDLCKDESWYYSTPQEAERRARAKCEHEVLQLMLRHDLLHLYDDLVKNLKCEVPMSCFYYLGNCFASQYIEPMKRRIIVSLQTHKSVAARVNCYGGIQLGFREATERDEGSQQQRQRWLLITLPSKILQDRGDLHKRDGVAIAIMYASFEDDSRRQFWFDVAASFKSAAIGFILRLTWPDLRPGLSAEQRAEAIKKMAKIVFQRSNPLTDAGVISVPKDAAQGADGIRQCVVTGQDMSDLLNVIQPYLPVDDVTLDTIIASTISIAKHATAARFYYTYLPFIEQIISKSTPLFLTGMQGPTSEARHLVSTLLLRYIVDIMGREPNHPGNWRRVPVGHCPCRDCARINAIFTSNVQVGGIKVESHRRGHLHNIFNNRRDGSYSIETIRTTYPEEFRITKHLGVWQKKNREWNQLAEDGKMWMKTFTDKGFSKDWLEYEEDFDDILALRVGALESKMKRRTREEVVVGGHALREDTRNRLKRAAEPTHGDGRPTKRTSGVQAAQPGVDFVDLTDD